MGLDKFRDTMDLQIYFLSNILLALQGGSKTKIKCAPELFLVLQGDHDINSPESNV